MRRPLPFAVLPLFLAALLVRAQAPAPSEPLRTAADRPVDIKHIRLDLKVDLPKKTVDAAATLTLESLRPLASFSLDAVEFEVKKVTLTNGDGPEGTPVAFSHDGKKLALDLDPAWPAGKTATLRIDYRVRDPRAGLYFFQPSPVERDVPLTAWSQGEDSDNRYWFPCLDQPNQKQSTELVVTVADGYEVLSNGKLIDKRPNGDGTVTFHWKQEKPHASYLVSLVVGKFDVVRDDWRGREVSYYVPVGKRDAVARTFGRTPAMIDYFSRRFGIDYPWEKYAQVVVEQFTAGGMENTSATTLTDTCLLDERALLDGDSDDLISHELAHQWWGDLVTCRDWAHVWLNEGFASYCEVLWEEHRRGADTAAYELLDQAARAVEGGKDRPVVDRRYPNPESQFDARAYPKGSWVLHMLRHRLGEDAFWKGMQAYGTENRYKSVETGDFRRVMERVSGRSLERFFYDWTERPGHPLLNVGVSYLADTKQVRIAVKQTQAGEAFQFPLPLAIFANGSSQPVRYEPQVTDKEHVFFVNVPGRPRMVLVDPDLTVLAEITEDKGHDQWATQLREVPTVAARVAAARHLGQGKRPEDCEALAAALKAEKFWGVQVYVARALGDAGGDASRDALVAGLKLSDARVRAECAEQLGKFHRDEKAVAALKAKLAEGDASYRAEAEAVRAYAKLQPPGVVAVVRPYLEKPSHNEVIRKAALEGLGASQDLSALDTLTAWTQRGKPRQARTTALKALAELARTANPSVEQRKRIVTAVSAGLENEGRRVRGAAVEALRELGRSAAPTLPALEAIARHDPDARARESAKKAVEAVRANSPAPLELTRLREELERLRKANAALQERLDRFERKNEKK
jgi:aminopeptidase N